MKKLIATTCALLGATALLADVTWVATVEIDSIQSLKSGVESFCRATEIPVTAEDVSEFFNDMFEAVLPLPSLEAAISVKDPVRMFVFEDSDQPLTEGGEPALLFSLTLPANAKAIQDQLAQRYTARRDNGNVITFTTPAADADIPPNMLLSVTERNKALLATSKDALAWFQQQQDKLAAFLPPPGDQTLRLCANVKHLKSLMPEMPNNVPNPLGLMLADLDYFSLAVTPSAQAVTLSHGFRAKAGTALASLLDGFKPPAAALWNGIPENALFANVAANLGTDAEGLLKFFGAYMTQVNLDALKRMNEKFPDMNSSESVSYLMPTKDKKAMCLVQVSPMKNAAAAREAIKALDQLELSPGVKYKKEATREAGGQTFER